MSTSSSYNSLSPSSPLGEFPSKPPRQQQPLPSPGLTREHWELTGQDNTQQKAADLPQLVARKAYHYPSTPLWSKVTFQLQSVRVYTFHYMLPCTNSDLNVLLTSMYF